MLSIKTMTMSLNILLDKSLCIVKINKEKRKKLKKVCNRRGVFNEVIQILIFFFCSSLLHKSY